MHPAILIIKARTSHFKTAKGCGKNERITVDLSHFLYVPIDEGVVMVNFTCKPDWAIGCTDI